MPQTASHSQATGRPGRRSRRKPLGRGLLVMLAVMALAGGAFAWWGPDNLDAVGSPQVLWRRLGWPLVRTVLFVAAGLLAGQLIESLGWTRRLGVLARPLIQRTHLPDQAGVAFTAAFASGVTANTLLSTAWQEGRLTWRQLVLANLLNASLPSYFLHLPTVFFVVYALLGQVALVYFGLTLAAALLRFLVVILLSRVILSPTHDRSEAPAAQARDLKNLWADTWRKFLVRLRRLLLIILPVYVVVFLLAQAGFFTWLGRYLAGVVSISVVPVEAMSVVVFAVVAEFTSGFAAAGALLASGGLAWQEVVLALLIGNVVATPVRALRHQLPHYMGIYAPLQGAKLLALGQAVRVASVILVAIVFGWWTAHVG